MCLFSDLAECSQWLFFVDVLLDSSEFTETLLQWCAPYVSSSQARRPAMFSNCFEGSFAHAHFSERKGHSTSCQVTRKHHQSVGNPESQRETAKWAAPSLNVTVIKTSTSRLQTLSEVFVPTWIFEIHPSAPDYNTHCLVDWIFCHETTP